MISTETEGVRSGLKLNPDSCKHPLRGKPLDFDGGGCRIPKVTIRTTLYFPRE